MSRWLPHFHKAPRRDHSGQWYAAYEAVMMIGLFVAVLAHNEIEALAAQTLVRSAMFIAEYFEVTFA